MRAAPRFFATPPVVSSRRSPRRPSRAAPRVVARACPGGGSNKRPDPPGLGLLEWLGPVVPQGALVTGVKAGWREAWRAMMQELAPQSRSGAYERPASAFDGRLSDPRAVGPARGPHPATRATPARYVAYVGNACPWCHRVTLAAAILDLGPECLAIAPLTDDAERASRGGWVFDRPDPVFGARDLREVYDLGASSSSRRGAGYRGRCTAPVLLDRERRVIVSNESRDIVRTLDDAVDWFKGEAEAEEEEDDAKESSGSFRATLRPFNLTDRIDETNDLVYRGMNDGVYRCGFATTQAAHNAAAADVADAFDELERRLTTSRFLCGDKLTESDVFLFPSVVRHDAVYASAFKCGHRLVARSPNLEAWMRDVYLVAGVAGTVDVDGYRSSYFGQLFPLNPGGIVPAGPTARELGLGVDPGRFGGGHARETVCWGREAR